MARKRSRKRSKKNSRFINKHSYRRSIRRKDKKGKKKKTRKKNKRGGAQGESSIYIHHFTDVLKLTYNDNCYSIIEIKDDRLHVGHLMKRNADNSYLFEDGIKDITEFNEYFDEFEEEHDPEFETKMGKFLET